MRALLLGGVVVAALALSRASGGSRWAWPVSGRLSSGFGPRVHPVTGELSNHNGQDIAVPVGTPVVLPCDGTVERVWSDELNGEAVRVKLSDGRALGFAHLSQVVVEVAEPVSAGQVVAYSGNTGRSTGPHLHLTLFSAAGEAVDPKGAFA